MSSVNIFGVNIKNTTLNDVMNRLKKELTTEGVFTIVTPNTEIVQLSKGNEGLIGLINSFDLIVPDGIGLIYASKIRGVPLKERVTGYDISIGLLEYARKNPFNLYLLGCKPGVAEKASVNVNSKYKGVNVVGFHHGYFDIDQEERIIEEINNVSPDVVFVGLGFPKQEEFIRRNKDKLNCKIIIGNGGVTDILAGVNKRAPEIFIKLNLEWFYRLLQEPSRITRQIALPKFLINVILDSNSVMKGDKVSNV